MGASARVQQRVVKATTLLAGAARPLRVLGAIDWAPSVRERFLERDGRSLPEVTYERVDATRSLERLARARGIRTGHAGIDAWLARHAEAIESTARMLEAIGTHDFYVHGRALYGDSSMPLRHHPATPLDMARSIHDTIDQLTRIKLNVAPPSTQDSGAIAKSLHAAVKQHFGDDAPAITIVPTLSANALATSTQIRIRKDARFTDRDAQQLLQHEAYIHVATSINGKHQDQLPILGVGYPYTTRTQEGLAVFAEVISSSMELDRMRRLADRVVAIQMAIDGADFLQVYQWFLDRLGQREQAFENTRRVFRGGVLTGGAPFTKDVTYLYGLLQVSNLVRATFACGRPDVLRMVFCGKLDIQDLPVLCELAVMGLCRVPRYVPPWASDPRGLLATLTYSSFMNRIDVAPLAKAAESLLADTPLMTSLPREQPA